MTPALLLLLACTGSDEGATADDTGGSSPMTSTLPLGPGDTVLPDAMDSARLLDHLDALQAIADSHDDTRLAGLEGYDQSAQYAADVLETAGYPVTWQEFTHRVFLVLSEPTLQVDDADESSEIATISYSAAGTATGAVVGADLVLPPGSDNSSTSGCEESDFDGFPAGAVALVQRGTCTYGTKAANAEAAGAVAVILFNEGQPDRQDAVDGTLGDGNTVGIPVVGATFALGEALAASPGALATVVVDVLSEQRPVHNLWADLPGTGAGIVVVGAHLDSVAAGPGINDNGSGTATVLELAVQASSLDLAPEHTLRFALWGAEESGLIGSAEYVAQLSEDDLAEHVANLNFDMVASENGVRFVYDGDDSADLGGFPGPDGSDSIEDLFTDFLDAEGLAWTATAFNGRSDYGPFIYSGVPAGGLFTGAEGQKTDAQAETYGGSANAAYDRCYHQACDTRDNIDDQYLIEMARAAAHATEALATGGLLEPVGTARAAITGTPPKHHARDTQGCAAASTR